MSSIDVTDGWREKLEGLAGRRLEAGVVAALVVLVAGVTLVLWHTRASPRIAPPARTTPATSAANVTPAATPLLVHVAGAVKHPGLYELPEGARVADAIGAAGGARRGADLAALNLASTVMDGVQVLVPSRGAATASTAPPMPGAVGSSPAPTPININTADQPMLETVPGIGPVTALAILEHRESVGAFSSVGELIDVSGIGPSTLESIRPYITV